MLHRCAVRSNNFVDSMSKPLQDNRQIVWRYMSFSRFMWLLQKQALWFSRVDRLDDEWEMALAGAQLDHALSRHPPTPLGAPEGESGLDRAKRIAAHWRRTTFVNCWSGFGPESHALWRIFCGPTEGVAIRTTLKALKDSVPEMEAVRVQYREPGVFRVTPTRQELVSVKRKSFEYETEIRIVATDETSDPAIVQSEMGIQVPFDFSKTVHGVVVHPAADQSFFDTVIGAVDHHAPTLTHKVSWSHMRQKPPLAITR